MSRTRNRYGNFATQRIPRERRRIPIPGSLDDSGEWYRCWYCGFINKIERSQESEHSNVETVYYPILNLNSLSGGYPMVVIGNFVYGEPLIYEVSCYGYYPVVSTGCSFCGCVTWRG